MKKVITGILIAVLLLVQPCAAFADASYGNNARESVAYLAYYFQGKASSGVKSDKESEFKLGHGTCFFVGEEGKDPQFILTNYHVVEQFYDCGAGEIGWYRESALLGNAPQDNEYAYYGRCKMRVYFEKENYAEAYPVAVDKSNDVAVFKLDSPTSERKPIALCSPSDDMVSSKVYAIGYPWLSENNLADSTTSYGVKDSSVTDGTISRMMTEEGTGTRHIEINCAIMPGNSGGPLVSDVNGAVIGINTWGVDAGGSSSINYAINIDEAISLMKINSVPFTTTTSEEPTTSDGTDTPDTPVVTQPVSNGGNSDDIGGKEPMPVSTVILIAVIAVLLIAAAVVAVLFVMSKKKKEEAQKQEQMQAQMKAQQEAVMAKMNQKVPVVRSLSEEHRGVRVNIQNKIITVGRSKSDCAIVFAPNTRGVSSRHCTVAWDANASNFVVVDLQSTYGTYLLNGQKLTPGIAYHLSAGDRFYLGERANMLSVDVE